MAVRTDDSVAPSEDDGAPVGPSESEEAEFLGAPRTEEPAAGLGDAPAPAENGDGEAGAALPPLAGLVEKIPAETRALLDELFRAKFTAVKRVRKKDLK